MAVRHLDDSWNVLDFEGVRTRRHREHDLRIRAEKRVDADR
jgi:hypothetical protein